MSMVTGVVNEIKAFPTKTGGTMYSLIVNGGRYGCGATAPKCKAGDTVSFETIQKGEYVNINMRTLQVTNEASTAQVAKQAVGAMSGGGGFDARQDTISKQAASNTAIAFVNMLVSADAVPGITAKLEPAKKYAILEALVERKANDFYNFATGKSLPKREAKAAVSDEVPSAAGDPDDALPEW